MASPRAVEGADVAVSIDVKLCVLIEVSRLDAVISPELDVEGIGVLKVLDLHGWNERSKNALCTVSPSGKSTTRRYLSSISPIDARRRISTVRLNHLPHGLFDDMLNPLQPDHCTIRAQPDGLEVSCELQPNRCQEALCFLPLAVALWDPRLPASADSTMSLSPPFLAFNAGTWQCQHPSVDASIFMWMAPAACMEFLPTRPRHPALAPRSPGLLYAVAGPPKAERKPADLTEGDATGRPIVFSRRPTGRPRVRGP